uniref:Putative secreted peptide n=1 Tax=Anopheles braziliensis TaxID=58242 RepID=A0A2M3ZR19_9DIPT
MVVPLVLVAVINRLTFSSNYNHYSLHHMPLPDTMLHRIISISSAFIISTSNSNQSICSLYISTCAVMRQILVHWPSGNHSSRCITRSIYRCNH